MSIMVVVFIIYYVKASQRDKIQDEEFTEEEFEDSIGCDESIDK